MTQHAASKASNGIAWQRAQPPRKLEHKQRRLSKPSSCRALLLAGSLQGEVRRGEAQLARGPGEQGCRARCGAAPGSATPCHAPATSSQRRRSGTSATLRRPSPCFITMMQPGGTTLRARRRLRAIVAASTAAPRLSGRAPQRRRSDAHVALSQLLPFACAPGTQAGRSHREMATCSSHHRRCAAKITASACSN